MKTLSKHLVQTGIVVAVTAAILGVSVSQAAASNSPEVPGKLSEVGSGRPSPDEPIETQIEQAIEEVNQEGQDALEEIGELDTPEKFDRAEQILQHMERTSYEIRKRAHDRTSDRFDELNDLAISRTGEETREELRAVGKTDTPEKLARAEEIRARNAKRKTQLEARWEEQKQRVEQRQVDRELPKADFRLPNGRPPIFAAAYGLRLRSENLTEEQADEAIAELERDGQTALERLGELDTPGKVQRARNMRATLAERLQDLRHRVANQNMDHTMDHDMDHAADHDMDQSMEHSGDKFEQQAHQFHLRAEAAINGLGELDTPEKQEQARQIKAKLGEALTALRERLNNVAEVAFEERLDRETHSLRRRTEAALTELGELDTPERQEKARLIKARLEQQVQKLRGQLARRSEAAFDEEFDDESHELRTGTAIELKDLGRLDTPEKVQEARRIRVRMEEAVNRLKDHQVRKLNENSGQRPDALTDFLENRGNGATAGRMNDHMDGNMPANLRDRAEQARQAQQKAITALREQRDEQTKNYAEVEAERARARARQAIKQNQDSPTPEPRVVEPVTKDSTPDTDSTESDGQRN